MRRLRRLLTGAVRFAIEIGTDASRLRIGPYAAQASFFIILSLVPFLMFVLSIVHIVLPYFLQISDSDMIRELNAIFPYRIALLLEDIVHDIFDRSSGISVVTAGLAIWFSSRGMTAVSQGISNVLSDGEVRNYFVARAMSLIYVFFFTILVALTIIVFGFGQNISALLEEKFPGWMIPISRVMHSREVIMFIILTFFFALFYRFMPKRRRKFRELIPGAALAAVLWIVFTRLFMIYVGFAKSYDSIYGSIAYVILAMLWLYFCLYIMLLCAEFNCWLKRKKDGRGKVALS